MLQVSPASISITGQLQDSAPSTSFQASVVGTDTGQQFYLTGTFSRNGIVSVDAAGNGSIANYTIQFAAPDTLGVGVYNDTITIKACYDSGCSRQTANSPLSVPVTYTVTEPTPQLYGLTPASTDAGAPGFTLTVSGARFTTGSQIQWNGSPRATTYIDSTKLTAQISASDIATSGTALVQVITGTLVSSTVNFPINPIGSLGLDQISPRHVPAGSRPFYVTTLGSGYTVDSRIAWNGAPLTTTYVSGSLLRALVTADLVASAGSASITVVDSSGQTGATPALTLQIDPPTLDAVSYQINAAHTGSIAFNNASLPANSTWSVDVGGSPSYALIAGGRVFVTVTNNSDSRLIALDAATGSTAWGPIAFSGLVNATYDNGRIFVVSGTTTGQVINALDASNGNPVWSATVPGGWFPEPPVASDGIVYTTNGGVVAAFDSANGQQLWTGGIGGTSGIVAVSLDTVYGASPCTAVALQPLAGTQLWAYNSGCSGGGGATPVASEQILYAPNSSGGSSGVVLNAQTGAVLSAYSASVIPAFTQTTGFFLFNGTLQGIARSNNQVLWSFAGDGQLATAPLVVNDTVFVGSMSGTLYALDAATGQQQWTQSMGAPIPPTQEYGIVMYTGLSAGDGLLVVPSGTKVTAFTLSTSP